MCKFIKFITIKQYANECFIGKLREIALQFIVKFYSSIFDGIVQLAREKYSQSTQFPSFRMHSF